MISRGGRVLEHGDRPPDGPQVEEGGREGARGAPGDEEGARLAAGRKERGGVKPQAERGGRRRAAGKLVHRLAIGIGLSLL